MPGKRKYGIPVAAKLTEEEWKRLLAAAPEMYRGSCAKLHANGNTPTTAIELFGEARSPGQSWINIYLGDANMEFQLKQFGMLGPAHRMRLLAFVRIGKVGTVKT